MCDLALSQYRPPSLRFSFSGFLSLSVRLGLCLSLPLPIFISFSLFISPSVCLSLSVCLSVSVVMPKKTSTTYARLRVHVPVVLPQVTNIFIPVIILTYCYTRMFGAIRAHSKRLQENSTLEQDIILAQQKKVTITLFIVLAVFIICALPYHLYATYTTIQKDKHFSPYLNPIVSEGVVERGMCSVSYDE